MPKKKTTTLSQRPPLFLSTWSHTPQIFQTLLFYYKLFFSWSALQALLACTAFSVMTENSKAVLWFSRLGRELEDIIDFCVWMRRRLGGVF